MTVEAMSLSLADTFNAGATRHDPAAPDVLTTGATKLHRTTEHGRYWRCPICLGWTADPARQGYCVCRLCGLAYAPEVVTFYENDIEAFRAGHQFALDYLAMAREETRAHAERQCARRFKVDEARFMTTRMEEAAWLRYGREADACAVPDDNGDLPKWFTSVQFKGECYVGLVTRDYCLRTAWPDVARKLSPANPTNPTVLRRLHVPWKWPGNRANTVFFQGDDMSEVIAGVALLSPNARNMVSAHDRIATEVSSLLHQTRLCDVHTTQVVRNSVRVLFTVKPDRLDAWLDWLARILPELAESGEDVTISQNYMMVDHSLCAAWVLRIDVASERLLPAAALAVRTAVMRLAVGSAG